MKREHRANRSNDKMTTIRTTCSKCGDVELTTSDICLELVAHGSTGSYRFECPFCGVVQRRPANDRVVSILLATGVTYEVVSTAGPITEQEIEVFAGALDQDGWFAELVSQG
ncbi:MAG: hypothetical protein ACE5GC_04265 [Acidimicrobiia bacterium]